METLCGSAANMKSWGTFQLLGGIYILLGIWVMKPTPKFDTLDVQRILLLPLE